MAVRELAVLVVSHGRADLLARTLDSVGKHLPGLPVHVWDNRSPGSAEVAELAARRPEVRWTLSDADIGRVAAMNRLAAQVPDHDMLHLGSDAELLGPLLGARAALAVTRVAVAAPTVQDPEGVEERWDVARRAQTVVRDLVDAAGYARRLRGRAVSDRYATAPTDVDGYLTGCCLLVSRDAWTEPGPFDERFSVHGEDAAWQRTARAAGWSSRLVDDPDPQVRCAAGGACPDDPLASRRDEELRLAAQVMVLGNARNRGPGTLLSLGTIVLDRVQRPRIAARRRRREAQRARAAGGPEVVITTNGLSNGGAERQRVLLANALVERRHPVTVVCLQKLGRYAAELDPRVRLVLQPWWQPVAGGDGDDAVVIGGVTNTEIGFARGWRALARATGQRRRWLPATHDPAVLDRPTYTARQARALRSADGLVVLSPQHRVDLTRHQELTPSVMVAPNGVPPVDDAAVRSGRLPASGPVRFGMLTRLVEYKNPLLLADALDALGPDHAGDWTLDVFGDGPDRARLEAATPTHLRDRVRWRGPSPGPDAAFTDIDVLCVPSGFEAFPMVMVEAMVRGIPVMASASGSVPDMLGHGAAGVVVEPVTREAWTAALARVLDDRPGLDRLAEAGRERAVAQYTDAAMADAYERAIAAVLVPR